MGQSGVKQMLVLKTSLVINRRDENKTKATSGISWMLVSRSSSINKMLTGMCRYIKYSNNNSNCLCPEDYGIIQDDKVFCKYNSKIKNKPGLNLL